MARLPIRALRFNAALLPAAICLLGYFLLCPALQAEESVFRTTLHGDIAGLMSNGKGRLNFRALGSSFSYDFTRRNSLFSGDEGGNFRIFRGSARPSRARLVSKRGAALDIVDGKVRIHVISARNGRPFRLEATLGAKTLSTAGYSARIYISPRTSSLLCAQEHLLHSRSEHIQLAESSSAAAVGAFPSFSLIAEADYDFYRSFKTGGVSKRKAVERARNEIASILNATDAIYMSQLGLSFSVSKISVTTNPSKAFGTTKSESVLRAYRASRIKRSSGGEADAYHLFSGIRYSGSVVGLAFLGTLCQTQNGNFAFGLTGQANSSIRSFVTAHELGHNLGATHISLPNSIMATFLSPSNNQFVAASISEINSYLAQHGSCLK